MADIFLSYQKRDHDLAKRMVKLLTAAGFTIWWDDDLTPRESWDRIIEREIEIADQVLVLWTPNSIQSDWVRIEANFAVNCAPSKLVQARFDGAQIPIAFSMRQYVDLNFTQPDRGASWTKLLAWLWAGKNTDRASPPPSTPAPASKPAPTFQSSTRQPEPRKTSPNFSGWAPLGLSIASPEASFWAVFAAFVAGTALFNFVDSVASQGIARDYRFYYIGLFGLPWAVYGLNKPGRVARLFFAAAFIPLCHYFAFFAAANITQGVNQIFLGGFAGGAVGAVGSFTGLLVLGGTVYGKKWLEVIILSSIILSILPGIIMRFLFSPLLLYVSWQLLFGFSLSMLLTGTLPSLASIRKAR